MALTESKIKDLKDKNFHRLFTNHRADWRQMAERASQFAKRNITDGRDPRPDDVAKALQPMMEVHEALRNHQDENKARADRYVLWFTEYVIDQILFPPEENQ